LLIGDDYVEDVLSVWVSIVDTGFSGLHFSDMSGEETPRRLASVRKRRRLDGGGRGGGTDNEADCNKDGNAEVSINIVHRIYKPLHGTCITQLQDTCSSNTAAPQSSFETHGQIQPVEWQPPVSSQHIHAFAGPLAEQTNWRKVIDDSFA